MIAFGTVPSIAYYDFDKVEKTLKLGAEPILIGRAIECQIRTEDAVVSRRHARIVLDADEYWIEDLGSLSGVFIGTEKVKRAKVIPGELIVMGSLVVRLVAEGSSQPGSDRVDVTATPQMAAQLEAAQAEIAELKKANERLRSNTTAASGLDTELKRARDDAARERKVRQTAVEGEREATKKSAALTAEIERLRGESDKLRADVDAARAAARGGTQANEGETTAALAALRAESAALRAEPAALRAEIDRAHADGAALRAELTAALADGAALRADAGKAGAIEAALQDELDRARANESALNGEIEALRADAAAIQAQLATARSDGDALSNL